VKQIEARTNLEQCTNIFSSLIEHYGIHPKTLLKDQLKQRDRLHCPICKCKFLTPKKLKKAQTNLGVAKARSDAQPNLQIMEDFLSPESTAVATQTVLYWIFEDMTEHKRVHPTYYPPGKKKGYYHEWVDCFQKLVCIAKFARQMKPSNLVNGCLFGERSS
jgi:hypothetical protein